MICFDNKGYEKKLCDGEISSKRNVNNILTVCQQIRTENYDMNCIKFMFCEQNVQK